MDTIKDFSAGRPPAVETAIKDGNIDVADLFQRDGTAYGAIVLITIVENHDRRATTRHQAINIEIEAAQGQAGRQQRMAAAMGTPLTQIEQGELAFIVAQARVQRDSRYYACQRTYKLWMLGWPEKWL